MLSYSVLERDKQAGLGKILTASGCYVINTRRSLFYMNHEHFLILSTT
jgi:hypothetical protein